MSGSSSSITLTSSAVPEVYNHFITTTTADCPPSYSSENTGTITLSSDSDVTLTWTDSSSDWLSTDLGTISALEGKAYVTVATPVIPLKNLMRAHIRSNIQPLIKMGRRSSLSVMISRPINLQALSYSLFILQRS